MALEVAHFVVTRDIALRTGMIDTKYRTKDGRFIVDNRSLSRVRFTPEEYVNGLAGVEMITLEEAETLIAQGGFQTGDSDEPTVHEEPTSTDEETNTETETTQEEPEE